MQSGYGTQGQEFRVLKDKFTANCRMKKQPFPELLYFGFGSVPSAQMHKHAFYQLEYCYSGSLLCQTGNKKFTLTPGELWLIPPGQSHHFLSKNTPYVYLSVKFNFDGHVPEIRQKDKITEYYLNVLWNLVSCNKTFFPYTPEGKLIIENHLCGILRHLNQLPNSESKESYFLMKLREEICSQGYSVNVEQLAQSFHCTRSQLKYRFTKENQGNSKIKLFIENILLDLAKNHVKYTSLSLSKIAAELRFPSIYVFSRFFKRKTGEAPSKYRTMKG